MRSEIVEKMSALITAAFGLVAALSWNSAIQSIFSKYYRQPGEDVVSQIIYAVTVTVIAVMITIWIGRVASKAKKREERIAKKLRDMEKKIKELRKKK
ncbi:MAG: DUF5654 family protein [Candidatus Nanoarchaeia archaeon]